MTSLRSAVVQRFLPTALAWLLLVAVAIWNPTAPALAINRGAMLRIMVIGDSITAGIGDESGMGGYRGPLEQLLTSSGYDVDFVGARSDDAMHLSDPYDEGWPGYVIRSWAPGAPGQLYGPLTKQALREYKPQVILLMAGTNDLLRFRDLPDFSDDVAVISMSELLREIFATLPHARVIVAGVVDSPAIPQDLIEGFDDGVGSLVQAYARRGYAITYADGMYAAVPRDVAHFPDGLHPGGDGGYDAIAGVWFKAIEAVTRPPT